MKLEVDSILLNAGYQVQNNADHHTFLSDEGKNLGGTDLGPTPAHMFLASISSCMAITAEMIARKRNFRIRDLQIHVEGEFNANIYSSTNTPGFSNLTYSIQMKSELTSSEQEAFIAEVQMICPILQTLKNTIAIQPLEKARP